MLSPLDIEVTFHPFRTLRQELVHPQDPASMNRRKGVVYSIPCAECPGRILGRWAVPCATVYVSTTVLYRMQTWQPKQLLSKSFCPTTCCLVDLSKATTIDAHPHTQTGCMLESWHVQHHHPQQMVGHHARTVHNTSFVCPLVFIHLCLSIIH